VISFHPQRRAKTSTDTNIQTVDDSMANPINALL
jgi:hypothetical protein